MSFTCGRGRLLLVVFSLSILLLSTPVSTNISSIDVVSRVHLLTPSEGVGTIVFDYSHGQLSGGSFAYDDDVLLRAELEAMGYTVIWAVGGLNASILSTADGLMIGSIYHEDNVFLASEITAIADWFNAGSKFLWVGCDSDFTSVPNSGQFINDNMAAVLEAVNSHVYPEPTAIEDPESNAGAAYRAIANQTSDDPFVSDIVVNVDTVLMHGPTLVYGSNNDNSPGVGIDPVALEDTTISDVYPLLYYSDFARIVDMDITSPIAHNDGDIGAFVAATMEVNAGTANDDVIIVSGASPYADYRSMHIDNYYEVWNGSTFVRQAIDFGMNQLGPTINDVSDVTIEEGQDIHWPFETISWHPNSTTPKCYNLTLDGTPFKDGLWNSSTEIIEIILEGHTQGEYNYTLTVENTANQTASDSAIVTVLATAAPVVNHPANITYTVGETGNTIHWEGSDTSLKDFSVYRDGVHLITIISVLNLWPHIFSYDCHVDGYTLGLYNLTIVVTDYLDLVSTDTVWIHVLEPSTTTTDITDPTTITSSITTTDTTSNGTGTGAGDIFSTMTIIISVGSIVIIVIVIVLIKRQT